MVAETVLNSGGSHVQFMRNRCSTQAVWLRIFNGVHNQVENAIRPAVVGRKNWLFCDTPDGAEASAVIYSVIETAKANNLNLEKYLAYLLSILPDRCTRDKNPTIDDLIPWQDQVRKACGAEY